MISLSIDKRGSVHVLLYGEKEALLIEENKKKINILTLTFCIETGIDCHTGVFKVYIWTILTSKRAFVVIKSFNSTDL